MLMNRILILIGIINQLVETKANRALKDLNLPMAQFTLLLHFSHNPEKSWTVTNLAKAFEVNQPAMTKTTQRLLKKGFLDVETESSDRRIKFFFVTQDGLATLKKAWEKMAPEIKSFFKEWESKDIQMFQEYLEQFKNQLDDNRD